jgi:hypothetical protein
VDGPHSFIAHGQKSDTAYAPSFSFDGALLTETQGSIHARVEGVAGWLEPEDSLKLYELGYLAPGPFLEIGTFRGKSTTVLASALRDAGRRVQFFSLDIDQDALESASGTLTERGLGTYVTLVHGSLEALIRAVPGFQPGFVFLDGDHSEAGVARDLANLETRVPEGGVLLFHDYLDERNDDPSNKDYGVRQAILRSWVARDCEYAGSFGCAGLYRRLRGPQAGAGGAAPALIELMAVDRLRVRLLVNFARPAKRFVLRALRRVPGIRSG